MGQLGVAIVGCGRISDLHAAAYKDHPDAAVAVACDINGDVARAKAESWGAGRCTDSFDEVLSDPAVDAVEILVPTRLHEEYAVKALEAGKHVSVQKPMAVSLPSADRMLAAARRAGKLLKVAENYVFFPPLVTAKKILDDGTIGEPTSFRMKMIAGTGGWEVPAAAWSWRLADLADGMGLHTFDHGHHMWASAYYMLGRFDAVTAWIDETDRIIDSPAVVQWRHESPKRYGQCEFQYGQDISIPSKYYADTQWFDIAGTKGVILVNRGTSGIIDAPAVHVYADGVWKEYDVDRDWGSGFIASSRNFIDAVLGREKPLLEMEEGRHVLAATIAIAKAGREFRTVYLEELDKRFPAAYACRRRLADRREKARFVAGLRDSIRKGDVTGETLT